MNLFTKYEVFGLPGSYDGDRFKNNTLMNTIVYSAHHPVDVHDIFHFTVQMEGGNIHNYKFISDCMKGMMDELDTRKKLFDLINFDGIKVAQVVGDIVR